MSKIADKDTLARVVQNADAVIDNFRTFDCVTQDGFITKDELRRVMSDPERTPEEAALAYNLLGRNDASGDTFNALQRLSRDERSWNDNDGITKADLRAIKSLAQNDAPENYPAAAAQATQLEFLIQSFALTREEAASRVTYSNEVSRVGAEAANILIKHFDSLANNDGVLSREDLSAAATHEKPLVRAAAKALLELNDTSLLDNGVRVSDLRSIADYYTTGAGTKPAARGEYGGSFATQYIGFAYDDGINVRRDNINDPGELKPLRTPQKSDY